MSEKLEPKELSAERLAELHECAEVDQREGCDTTLQEDRVDLLAHIAHLEQRLAEAEELLTKNGVGFNPEALGSLAGRIQMLINWKNNADYGLAYNSKRAEAAEQEAERYRQTLVQVANCRCEEDHTCVRVAREMAQAALAQPKETP